MAPAVADTPYVGGAGAISIVDGYSHDTGASLAVIRGNAGIDLSRYFGLEGHLGFGLIEDQPKGQSAKVSIENYFAGYGRLIWPLSEVGRLFALVGVAQSTIKSSENGASSKDDVSSLSYGLGGEIAVTDSLRVGTDVIVLANKGNTTIWSLAAGARWYF